MTENKKKKVLKISQLLAFTRAANDWINMKADNKNLALAKYIFAISPQINELIKPYNEATTSFRNEVEKIKNSYATSIKVIENSQLPNHSVCEYDYTSENLVARNKELESKMKYFTEEEKAIMDREVEVEVSYVPGAPASNILPDDMRSAMTGIVIEPKEERSNIEVIR